MCGKKSNRTFLQKLLPCKSKTYDSIPPPPPPPPYPGYGIGYGDNKGKLPPPYTLTNMYTTPYGASAAHVPTQFLPDMKPGVFKVWGITGYTGSIDAAGNLTPSETACHLAKMQQAMVGHTKFDHSTFAQASPPTPTATDTPNTNNDDIPKPPTPTEADLKKQEQYTSSYSGYIPAYPGYGLNFGLAPPPCPPDPPKDKKPKEDNKCKRCAGASGHPVKKIKKLDGELLCWACVWRTYAGMAEEVWKESGDVKGSEEDEE